MSRYDPNRPQAHILTVNHEETERGNDTGLLIRVTFNLSGVAWRLLAATIGAWFTINGQQALAAGSLSDSIGRVLLVPGQPVCVRTTFHPGCARAYEDLELFLPYRVLPSLSSGGHTLGYVIRVLAGEMVGRRGRDRRWTFVAASEERTLPLTITVPLSAKVVQVKEESVVRDGVEGLLIHVSLSTSGMNGRLAEAAAFFALADGSPLGDTDGQVAVVSRFTPTEEREDGRYVELFLPLAQLHPPVGRHRVRYNVAIGVQEPSGAWRTLTRSQPREFSIESS